MFFLTPQPTEFKYSKTVRAEVIEVLPPKSPNGYKGDATARVELNSGSIVFVSFRTRKLLLAGDEISVDILEADGRNPRYRLAQDSIQP